MEGVKKFIYAMEYYAATKRMLFTNLEKSFIMYEKRRL